ncbi:MAG: hypothetical protein ACJ749_03300, partial [Flavisolibacter sp.]
MKKEFISCLIALSFFACKKNESENDAPIFSSEKTWKVTTVAGGEAGFVNGTPATARFHFPTDVMVGLDGSLYVLDLVNSGIRRITVDNVSTFTGYNGYGIVDGAPATAQFQDPINITRDESGNFFTTDGADPRIRKITPTGDVSVFA